MAPALQAVYRSHPVDLHAVLFVHHSRDSECGGLLRLGHIFTEVVLYTECKGLPPQFPLSRVHLDFTHVWLLP